VKACCGSHGPSRAFMKISVGVSPPSLIAFLSCGWSHFLGRPMVGPVRILIAISLSCLSNCCLIGRRNSSTFSASVAVAL
jgi:hypothetical protein